MPKKKLKKMFKRLFCKHRYRVASPGFCMGNGVMAHEFVCEICGKRKIM